MTNPKKSKEIGKKGESLAKNYLKVRGFTILVTNYHSKYGEIDIVATKLPGQLHFFEVKTRSPYSMNRPEESITYQKRQRLIKTALTFLQKTNPSSIKSWRISLISILLQSARQNSRPQIELIDIY